MTKKLTDYRSFWTVWLGSAGSEDGKTLFNIQKEWGITTNYLYHKEPGIGKPISKAMLEDGFLKKNNKKFRADLDWTSDYVIGMNRPPKPGEWSLNLLMIERWPEIQEFINKNRKVLFSPENLKILYGDLNKLAGMGPFIFEDIFLMIIISNILPFCTKYSANIVSRILYTMLSLLPGRNTLGYFLAIYKQLDDGKGFPRIVADENLLMDILYPLE